MLARYRPRIDSLEDRCLLSLGITEYNLPTRNGDPLGITAGPDGNLWFTEEQYGANKIGRITPAGVVTEFQLPGTWTGPLGITAGPDGNLWFTVSQIIPDNLIPGQTARIGYITPKGAITEFPAPGNGTPWSITAGPDGNLWYVSATTAGSFIGRVTPAGVITTFPTPTFSPGLEGITKGPDGNLWFTEANDNKIGRITPSGTITEFALPPSRSGPYGIVAGPDGNLWFAAYQAIGRITPDGKLTLFALPAGHSGAAGITVGADGNLWFSEFTPTALLFEGVYIGKITTSGALSEYLVPTTNDYMAGITSGPDGNIWFVESAGKIGHLVLDAPDIAQAPSLTVAPNNIFTGTVATFTDPQAPAAGQYSATINWGDGSSSPGSVSGAGQKFVVTGDHAFGGGFGSASMPLSVILHGPNGVATAASAQVLVINPEASFVQHLYADLLHRQADAAGLNHWMGELNNGVTHFQVALEFQESIEYRSGVINGLYATLLGRSPDPGGRAGFLGFLSQGGSAAQAEQMILSSAEFYQRAGASATGFLSALYHAVLGRGVDPSGAVSLGAFLANGAPTGLVAGLVMSSQESKQDLVQSFYQRVLHRAADPGGLATFSAELEAGMSDAAVMATLAASNESLLLAQAG
jgi:streptogramin lyase